MEDKNEIQKVDTFLAYNQAISIINMANSVYNEQTKSSCDLMVAGALGECHPIKDVYERALQYMIDKGIYERFIKSILEIQYQKSSKKETLEENSKEIDNPIENDKHLKGNTKTKSNKTNKNIIKDLIDKMYNEDEE